MRLRFLNENDWDIRERSTDFSKYSAIEYNTVKIRRDKCYHHWNRKQVPIRYSSPNTLRAWFLYYIHEYSCKLFIRD